MPCFVCFFATKTHNDRRETKGATFKNRRSTRTNDHNLNDSHCNPGVLNELNWFRQLQNSVLERCPSIYRLPRPLAAPTGSRTAFRRMYSADHRPGWLRCLNPPRNSLTCFLRLMLIIVMLYRLMCSLICSRLFMRLEWVMNTGARFE